jgi:hypothetical protein
VYLLWIIPNQVHTPLENNRALGHSGTGTRTGTGANPSPCPSPPFIPLPFHPPLPTIPQPRDSSPEQ